MRTFTTAIQVRVYFSNKGYKAWLGVPGRKHTMKQSKSATIFRLILRNTETFILKKEGNAVLSFGL